MVACDCCLVSKTKAYDCCLVVKKITNCQEKIKLLIGLYNEKISNVFSDAKSVAYFFQKITNFHENEFLTGLFSEKK